MPGIQNPRMDTMFLLQRFARNASTVSSAKGRGRPNSENLSASHDGSICRPSDRDCQQAVEPNSYDAAIGDATDLALLAQCVP